MDTDDEFWARPQAETSEARKRCLCFRMYGLGFRIRIQALGAHGP